VTGLLEEAAHHDSHMRLLTHVRQVSVPAGDARLDAVVVPTNKTWECPSSRDPDGLRAGIRTALSFGEQYGCSVIFMASGAAIAGSAPRALRRPGVLVVDVERWDRWGVPRFRTSGHHRAWSRDVGLKRNVGLLIAQRCHWTRLLFLDDDVSACPPHAWNPTRRTLDQRGLDSALVALDTRTTLRAVGWRPMQGDHESTHDNSLLGHARRAAGDHQGVFVGGGALLVRCDADVPFFPHTYNEDWLFMFALAYSVGSPVRALGEAGNVWHAAYDPFTDERARAEEFGDQLAEGLYGLLHHRAMSRVFIEAGHPEFWRRALQRRREMLRDLIRRIPERRIVAALEVSLAESLTLQADSFVDFLRRWRVDLGRWGDLKRNARAGSPEPWTPERAIKELGLEIC
jgi:hypothetical protein